MNHTFYHLMTSLYFRVSSNILLHHYAEPKVDELKRHVIRCDADMTWLKLPGQSMMALC